MNRDLTSGDGNYIPYNPKLKDRARLLRKDMTLAERKLWYDYLRSHKYKFIKQKPIDHYIADFYCSEAKLIIELDGDIHTREEVIEYDLIRDQILRCYGLNILRFKNQEVMNEFSKVCKIIEAKLTNSLSQA